MQDIQNSFQSWCIPGLSFLPAAVRRGRSRTHFGFLAVGAVSICNSSVVLLIKIFLKVLIYCTWYISWGASNDFWSYSQPLLRYWHKRPPNLGGGNNDNCPPKALPLPPKSTIVLQILSPYRHSTAKHIWRTFVSITSILYNPTLPTWSGSTSGG